MKKIILLLLLSTMFMSCEMLVMDTEILTVRVINNTGEALDTEVKVYDAQHYYVGDENSELYVNHDYLVRVFANTATMDTVQNFNITLRETTEMVVTINIVVPEEEPYLSVIKE